MKTIYLLRHGEIPGSSPRRFVGQTELDLTACGREQMRRTAGRLKGAGVDRLVASPLGRCRESAGIVGAALGLSPEIEPAFSEITLGDWEGLTIDDVRQRFPGSYEERGKDIANFRPPAGESFVDLSDRAWPVFLRILAGEAKSIVIVGHAGVNRVLLCHLLQRPLAQLLDIPQDYGCINILEWVEDTLQVRAINQCAPFVDGSAHYAAI